MEISVSFGPFLFFPHQFRLLRAGCAVNVSGRALSVLAVLCERQGHFVSQAEIMERAWPGLHVTEGSLRFQINVLRKALACGEGRASFIVNHPGSGYAFRPSGTQAPSLPAQSDGAALQRLAPTLRA